MAKNGCIECGAPAKGRYCAMHYGRLKRYGSLTEVHRGSRMASRDCLRGHSRTPENTYYRQNGVRDCRDCRADSRARYLERKRTSSPPLNSRLGCIHGHDERFMKRNTYGARICTECRRLYQRRGRAPAATPTIDPKLRGHGWNRRKAS